ncbi:MAG: SBBP repeat-containing protein [Saprospiraceae bacterium]
MIRASKEFKFILSIIMLGVTWYAIAQGIPRRDWGTYIGGIGNDNFRDMVLDPQGNVYAVGSTGSGNNIATPGNHQSTLSGEQDVLLVKFNNQGKRIWGTYLGGPDFDFGQSIALDSKGNIFICGGTRSTSNFTTPGTHQPTFGGGTHDAFLAKFTNDGTLLWSTYIGGGNGEESANSLVVNKLDQILITGWTESLNNISTPGAHQVNSGGTTDIFLMKFDNNGVKLWGTYQGDIGFDLGLQVKLDQNENILISGWTSSTANFSTFGSFQPAYSGGTADAYISKYSQDGALLWCTYQGGLQEEYGDVLLLDKNDFIYLAGPCNSVSGLATPGTDQPSIGGNYDGFVMKLTPDGRKIWGTYLGGKNNDNAYGLALDSNQNIYVAGYTESDNGLATPTGYQTSYGGNNDVFLLKYTNSGKKIWGTYYGANGTDAAFAVKVDLQQHIFIAGHSGSNSTIASIGAHQEIFGGGIADGLLVKFSPCTDPQAIIPGRTICASMDISDTLYPIGTAPYSIYLTVDGNRSLILNSIDSFVVIRILNGAWTDSVRVDSIKSLDCKGALSGKTLYKKDKKLINGPIQTNCNQNNITYTVSFTINNPDIILIGSPQFLIVANRIESLALPFDQSYSVKFINPSGCDTILLTGISGCKIDCPPVNSKIEPLSPACIGDAVKINSVGRSKFLWSGPEGFTSTFQNPFLDIKSTTQSGVYRLITSDLPGCTDTLYTYLLVNARPILKLSTNSPLCVNNSLQLNATGGISYVWSGPNNFTSTIQNPVIKNLTTLNAGRYRVMVTDQNGCRNTDSTDVMIEASTKTTISGPDSICQTESVELTASGTGSFLWDAGQLSASIKLFPKQSTTYKVIHTLGACKDTAQIFINVKPIPVITISGLASITKGSSIQLKASGASNFSWTPGSTLSCVNCPQPIATPVQNIIYCVSGTLGRCIDTACISIEVKPECKIFLPNVFTPNGDNTNDQWCPYSSCIIITNIEIFNRWGALIFKSNENNTCWDGMDMNRSIQSGVYIYRIEALNDQGIKIYQKGDLTLIK